MVAVHSASAMDCCEALHSCEDSRSPVMAHLVAEHHPHLFGATRWKLYEDFQIPVIVPAYAANPTLVRPPAVTPAPGPGPHWRTPSA